MTLNNYAFTMGKPKAQGKITNAEFSAEDDGGTALFAEEDEDATTSSSEVQSSQPNQLANILGLNAVRPPNSLGCHQL